MILKLQKPVKNCKTVTTLSINVTWWIYFYVCFESYPHPTIRKKPVPKNKQRNRTIYRVEDVTTRINVYWISNVYLWKCRISQSWWPPPFIQLFSHEDVNYSYNFMLMSNMYFENLHIVQFSSNVIYLYEVNITMKNDNLYKPPLLWRLQSYESTPLWYQQSSLLRKRS